MNLGKIKLFWEKYKVVGMVFFVSIATILCLLVFPLLYCGFGNVSETTKGIIGTVIGAIVGGNFTLLGSLIINQNTQKTQNARRRKIEIYKPLYDEIKANDKILKSNPYPNFIAFEKIQQDENPNCPHYIEWGKIENDTRIFEVPQDLKNAMGKLYEVIGNYEKQRDLAARALYYIYEEEARKIKENSNCDTFLLLSGVLLDDTPLSITSNLWEHIIKRANMEPDIDACKKAKTDWNNAERNASIILKKLIEDTVDKYEK